MFPVLIEFMRSSYTESNTSSANPEPRSKFHFMVKQNHVIVRTMSDGSQISVRQSSNLLPEQVFNVEFSYLLLPVISKRKIHAMFTQMEIPADSIERMKRQISQYAFDVAWHCSENMDACEALDIFIGLNVPLVEYVTSLDDIGGGEGSMRLVPASRSSSIQALEIKKFDDIEEDPSSSSSSTETCMICMDEYVRGVDVARLPCSHVFHGGCILKWLERKNSCPLCRSVLLPGA